jgi:hypothetical protein
LDQFASLANSPLKVPDRLGAGRNFKGVGKRLFGAHEELMAHVNPTSQRWGLIAGLTGW